MQFKKILEKLKISSADVGTLIVCLGVTVLISMVYYNYGSVNSTYNVVVNIKDDGQMVATEKDGQPLRNFTVKISTKSTEKIDDANIKAIVDLRSRIQDGQFIAVTDEGEYDFPIIIDFSSTSDVNKFEYSPKTVRLRVEHKTEEWIKIVPTFSGELGARGYEISEKTLSPDRIKISGGRTIVERAKMEALTTEAIDLGQITNKYYATNISVKPNLSMLDERLNVNLESDTVFTLSVKLAPIQGKKNFDGVEISLTNLSENLEITNKNISVSVSLKGTELSLEQIDPSKIFVTADCVSVTKAGTYEIPLTVTPPTGTSILDQPQSVRIWVTEIKKEDEIELEIPTTHPIQDSPLQTDTGPADSGDIDEEDLEMVEDSLPELVETEEL